MNMVKFYYLLPRYNMDDILVQLCFYASVFVQVMVGCPVVTDLANGAHSPTTNGAVTTVTYTCSIGYTMNGTQTPTCQTNGQWSSPKPVCIKCDTLTTMSGRTDTLSSNGTTSTVTFTCEYAYQLQGPSIMTCNKMGFWSDVEPTCVYLAMTPSNDNGNGLLVAVIVLSVLLVVLAVAFGVVMRFIRNFRRKIKNCIKKEKKPVTQNGYLFSSSRAPADHQHATDVKNLTSTLSVIATPYATPRETPRYNPTRDTPSTFSTQALQLALIRDTTSSEIFSNDQPAPWSIRKQTKYEHAKGNKIDTSLYTEFPPIPKSTHLVADTISQNETRHANPKKRSLAAKLKQHANVSNKILNPAFDAESSSEYKSLVPRLIRD